MPSLLRYRKWTPVPERAYVQGRFYLDGRLVKRAIATLEEAEYRPDGSKLPGAAAEKRRERLLRTRWEAMLVELREAARDRPRPADGTGILLSAATRDFLASQRQYRRPRTVELQERTLLRLRRTVGDVPLAAIDSAALRKFTAALAAPPPEGKPLAPVSINIELRHARRFLRWCQRQTPPLLAAVPHVEMMRHTRAVVRPADPDAVWALWDALTAQRAAADPESHHARLLRCWQRLLFNLMRGMRRGEAAHRLQADYLVDRREDAWVWVRDNAYFQVKQHLEQRYPIGPDWVAWIQRELRETPTWTYWCQLQDVPARPAWRDAHAVTTLMRRHWHITAKAIRKAVSSNALASGAEAVAVSALLGHSQLKTTDNHYLDSREPLKRRAAQLAPFGTQVAPARKRKRKQRAIRDS